MTNFFPSNRQLQQGFTLLELMAVVLIIAILVAIAIPGYNRYMYRARRDDGQELLMRIAQAQERYFTANNQYATTLAAIGFNGNPVTSQKQFYRASVATQNGNAEFIATATPINAQTGDACGPLTLSSTGQKTPLASNAAANSNGHCW